MQSGDIIPGKTCANCEKPIPWRPGTRARAQARYCSEGCRRAKSEFIPGKACLECSGPIPWREGRTIRERTKFCGNPCKRAYQSRNPPRPRIERTTVPCATCGETVSFLPSQRGSFREDRSDNIYCSRKCKGIGHSKIMTGRRPSNGIYSSPSSFRGTIRREFHDRCAICGWDKAPNDVCHIMARKNGGTDELGNVTILCPNHHRLFDLGLIPVEQIQATRENVLKH